jgi:O-antigen/teichoic acid export membrane protein
MTIPSESVEERADAVDAADVAVSMPDGPRKRTGMRSVATSIVNRFGITAINMATGILTARALHPAGRGELTAMTLWPLFLANATALGTPSSLIYHLRKHREQRGELIASALAMVTTLGAVAAVVGVFVLPHWLGQYPAEVVRFAQLFLIAAPLWAIQITGQAALEALELFSYSNLVQIMIPATTLAGLVTVLATHRMSPVAAAGCYAAAIVPTALTILALLWRQRFGFKVRMKLAAVRMMLSYGVRSAPLDLLGTLNLYMDQVLVVGLLAAANMGAYNVVLSLSRALLMFQGAVVMVLFPKAAGRSEAEILTMVGRAVRVSTLVTGTAAITAALLGPLMVKLLYGTAFLTAVPALRVLLCEVVLQGAVVIVTQAFLAAGRPGTVSILQGCGLALAVPLMFVFIPRFGVAGAALALLCSTATRLVLLLVAVPLTLKQRLPRLVPGVSDVELLWKTVLRRG